MPHNTSRTNRFTRIDCRNPRCRGKAKAPLTPGPHRFLPCSHCERSYDAIVDRTGYARVTFINHPGLPAADE
jgi:hypothetical protein